MDFNPPQTSTPEPTPSPILPPTEFKAPTPAQQQWGAMASIIIIVLMIVIGAFYAWGKRIAEQQAYSAQTSTETY